MLHDGDMRRSEDEFEEATIMGTSAAVWKDIPDGSCQSSDLLKARSDG
jgi:hypothetical protein